MQQPAKAPQAPKPAAVPRQEDLGDAASVGERKVALNAREQRRLNGLKMVLANPDSRLWLHELLGFCGVSRSSFTGNSHTFFNEGQRNVGLKITADMTKHFPEQYLDMLKEEAANA